MPTHKFENYHYLAVNGKIKKMIEQPIRERLLVRTALTRMGVVFRELVVFRNPLYNGPKGDAIAAPQWLDFCVYTNGLRVLLFTPNRIHGGAKKVEKIADEAKKNYLNSKDIPYLVLGRKETSQIYEWRINRFLRRQG